MPDLPAPVAAFKHYYQTFDQQSLDDLDGIYSQDVTFTDPVHVIQGRDKLKTYFKSMCGKLTACRFEFIDETIQDGTAFFKWQMHYRHPSIQKNASLQLVGASAIKFSDKIDSHEDFYDMGAMLYEHIALLGSAIRVIKSRISKEQ